MKKIMFFLFFCTFFPSAFTQQVKDEDKIQIEKFESGDRGIFEYKWLEDNDFVIWRKNKEGAGKYGIVGGIITPKTKIVVKNAAIQKKDLILLNGKEVVVMGKFRQEGIGEGSKVYCEELIILILFDQYR